MKKIFFNAALSAAFLLIFTTACADKVEIDERAFVTAIGVDLSDGGMFDVTVSCANPSAVSGGSSSNGEKQLIKTASGGTITECLKEIDAELVGRLYLGHLKAFVLGETLLNDRAKLEAAVFELSDGEKARHDMKRGTFAIKAESAEETLKIEKDEGSVGLFAERYYKNNKKTGRVTIDAFVRGLRGGKMPELPILPGA